MLLALLLAAAPHQTQTINVGDAFVIIDAPLVALEETVGRVGTVSVRGDSGGPVTVSVCRGERGAYCDDGDVMVVEPGGRPVAVDLHQKGVVLERGDVSVTCCAVGVDQRVIGVVGGSKGRQVDLAGVERGSAVALELGDALDVDAGVALGVSAVLVPDDAPLGAAAVEALVSIVAWGGAVSLDAVRAEAIFPQLRGRSHPDVARVRGGIVVTRAIGASPLGATDAVRAEAIAALIAAAPGLAASRGVTVMSGAIEAAAAGVGPARREVAVFALCALCALGVAGAVWSARKRGSLPSAACALRRAGAVSLAGIAAIVALVAVSPAEQRTRVVARVGPGGAWEVGAEAIRPQFEADVTIDAPAALRLRASILGEDPFEAPPSASRPSASRSDDDAIRIVRSTAGGRATGRVSARIASSSALVAWWMRPVPAAERARITVVRESVSGSPLEIENDSGAALDIVLFRSGVGVTNVPAGARVELSASPFGYDGDGIERFSIAQRRLIAELHERCASGEADRCGAAVGTLADGTLIAFEVRR